MKPINRTQHVRYAHTFTISLPHYMATRYEVQTSQGIEQVGDPKIIWRKVAGRVFTRSRAQFTFKAYKCGTIRIASHYLDKPDLKRRPTVVKIKGAISDYPTP